LLLQASACFGSFASALLARSGLALFVRSPWRGFVDSFRAELIPRICSVERATGDSVGCRHVFPIDEIRTKHFAAFRETRAT